MANQILFTKERDFLDLNREIEQKVQNLVMEVDLIIDKQENFIRTPVRSTPLWMRNDKKPEIKQQQQQQQQQDENVNPEETGELDRENKGREAHEFANAKENRKNTVNETIIRFLKAQIEKLQSDIRVHQRDARKMSENYKSLEAELQKQNERNERLLSQLSCCKETLTKNEESNDSLQSKIQVQNTEISSLKKEIETLKKDIKHLNHLSTNSEVRLNRSLEENEKLRLSIKACQSEEKELREQIRRIQEEKKSALKNSEKQRTEVLQAFKKQTQLVDNLKKQKAYLEASRGLQFIEDDFTKLLEWKCDKT